MTLALVDDRDRSRADIVADVAAALAAGRQVTTVGLAAQYGRSDRWARRIKAEARELMAADQSAPDTEEADQVAPETGEDTEAAPETPSSQADVRPEADGRGVALAVFVGGILVSVAFNLLAVAEGPIAALVLSPVWPLALLGSVELATRNVWPEGGLWAFVRWTATATVAVAAGWISFGNIAAVVAAWGADPVSAALAPVAIDGAMLLAGVVLAQRK